MNSKNSLNLNSLVPNLFSAKQSMKVTPLPLVGILAFAMLFGDVQPFIQVISSYVNNQVLGILYLIFVFCYATSTIKVTKENVLDNFNFAMILSCYFFLSYYFVYEYVFSDYQVIAILYFSIPTILFGKKIYDLYCISSQKAIFKATLVLPIIIIPILIFGYIFLNKDITLGLLYWFLPILYLMLFTITWAIREKVLVLVAYLCKDIIKIYSK